MRVAPFEKRETFPRVAQSSPARVRDTRRQVEGAVR